MSSITDNPAIVIDTGSAFCKSGFGGDHFPRSVIPSVVGRWVFILYLIISFL